MLLLYGTCQSVPAMILVRFFQGAFNGAVGVARSSIKDVTDVTNEGRAYAIMGLCWSLGGMLGPVAGGWLEHPVENIPRWFGNNALFTRFPYLLPCMAAAAVTGTGCVLSVFLSYDGGARTGGIRLPDEKDVETAVEGVASLPRSIKKKLSGYLSQGDPEESGMRTPTEVPGSPMAGPTTSAIPTTKHVRASFALPHYGSAYGYEVSRRNTGISRYRRNSAATSNGYAPDYEGDPSEGLPPLNFAQK